MFDISTISAFVTTLAGGVMLFGVELPAEPAQTESTVPTRALQSIEQTPIGLKPLTTERSQDGRLYLPGELNDAPFRFMVDTAATHTVISVSDARRANVEILGETRVRTAAGVTTAYYGRVQNIAFGENMISDHRVLIMKDLPVALVGMDVLHNLKGNYIAL